MFKFEIRVMSVKHDLAFVLETLSEEPLWDFLTLFEPYVDQEQTVIRINAVQQNSIRLRDSIDLFLAKYGTRMPQVNHLKQIVSDMKEGESFLVLSSAAIGTEQLMKLHAYLISVNEGSDFHQLNEEFQGLFSCVWQNYDTLVFGNNRRVRIGEPNKTRRVCRFCGRSGPDAQFRKKAHAISEGLGNKNIVLNEECDECNEHFGRGIEQDLIRFLDFLRSFYGISGKQGKPKIKGKNFTLQQGEKGFEILSSDVSGDPTGASVSSELRFREKLRLQNLYRALCKYALSVIDSGHLRFFQETIRWIRGERVHTPMPKVATRVTYRFMEASPSIAVYLRKVSDTNLPHLVGEFQFTCLVLVFIVPFSTEDDKTFCGDAEFETFWDCFKHYSRKDGWTYRDFSDDSEREFILNVNFVKRNGSTEGPNPEGQV